MWWDKQKKITKTLKMLSFWTLVTGRVVAHKRRAKLRVWFCWTNPFTSDSCIVSFPVLYNGWLVSECSTCSATVIIAPEFDYLAQLENLSLELWGNGINTATAMYDFSQPDNTSASSSVSASPRYEKGNLWQEELLSWNPANGCFINVCLSQKPCSYIYWFIVIVRSG